MVKRTPEVSVPMPEVRGEKTRELPALDGIFVTEGVVELLEELDVPYEEDDFAGFPEHCKVALETLLENLETNTALSEQKVSDTQFAVQALITVEAESATRRGDIEFLCEAISRARHLAPDIRPFFAYQTPLAVEKIQLENEAQAAEVLGIMLDDTTDVMGLDGWMPVIDWDALQMHGFESAGRLFPWKTDCIGYEPPLYPGLMSEEYIGKPVQGQFTPPKRFPAAWKEFAGTHNSDIANMQRWAEWFSDYRVSGRLHRELLVVKVALAMDDPKQFWIDHRNQNRVKPDLNFL